MTTINNTSADAERAVYEYGPEGMPRVERMPDMVLNCLIDHSLFRYFAAGLNGEGRQRLHALLHDTANEVLARVSAWPTPATADVAADLSTIAPFAYCINDADGIEYNRIDEFSGGRSNGVQLYTAAQVQAILNERLAAGAPAETVKAVTDAQIEEIASQHDLYSIQDGGKVSGDTLLSFARDVLAAGGAPGDGEKDAARLDFLDSRHVVGVHQYEPTHGNPFIEVEMDDLPTVRGLTVREAIDAAIAAVPTGAPKP